MVFVPLLILPFMGFGGFFQNRGNYGIWIGWIEYISPFKYAFQALSYNQFEGT